MGKSAERRVGEGRNLPSERTGSFSVLWGREGTRERNLRAAGGDGWRVRAGAQA